jgi:hypothetical protein
MRWCVRGDGSWAFALLLGALLGATSEAVAGQASSARAYLPLAAQAADAWADDARLVWLENDAPVDTSGTASAWGFLYYSPVLGAMRSWSIRNGKIEHAEDHAVRVTAPALRQEWLDSSRVVAGALSEARRAGAGALESLVLSCGVFHAEVAWVAVFATSDSTKLYVVVDANAGDVVRSWRG